ncbi:NlpC/P60 family protein [Pseudooceanicola antarcticus]|uniref:NlpC/P60 family protein n=1 Tax=Pseudooceanicola antarcticus TaxID=1247613 RepID=A0A285HJL4_9RHOB|nr:NlpC/P60 family protein [Pseudooceanicola antarcticus]SNY35929.1 NlpC/P60 family protein [Pseudooceanicola antarcticus]
MSAARDRRWPANARVAAERLRGQAGDVTYLQGEARLLGAEAADLLDAPGGARDRQLLRGAALRVYEFHQGFAFVEAEADGYTGYLDTAALAPAVQPAPNASVACRETLVWEAPNARSMARSRLSFGAGVHVLEEAKGWARCDIGHIPANHLNIGRRPQTDPVEVAERLLGMPYLWGANGAGGIDCSGLVQLACHACGIACPGDSDMQAAELGQALPESARLQRGDLLFWKGHVAWVSGPDQILHANGYSMNVAYEGLSAAMARMDDAVIARRRL